MAQTAKPAAAKKPVSNPSGAVERGQMLFAQDCAFCHGRDAAGGESGPDLTRSKLVAADIGGDKVGLVVRNGRLQKGMPAFQLSQEQILDLLAFLHDQTKKLAFRPGGRRGVDVADLQTGNIEAGKAYFNGPGKCSSCHSPTGDLAGVATRYVGLDLEKRMLYPEGAKAKLTVTFTSGETVSGTLAYQDEFTVGLIDAAGWYCSWRTDQVKFTVDDPANAHVEQFEKYSDADIHNLMAYLQTLR
jgi:cytochrome c oxidase cbb3-type subunit 3